MNRENCSQFLGYSAGFIGRKPVTVLHMVIYWKPCTKQCSPARVSLNMNVQKTYVRVPVCKIWYTLRSTCMLVQSMPVKCVVIRVQNSEVRNREVTQVTGNCKNAYKNKWKILGCHSRVANTANHLGCHAMSPSQQLQLL